MKNTGKLIQELRIKAGFTQKTLAEALHITDKAISKWERGLAFPDITLLPRLSLLLDVDIEVLLSKTIEQEEWVGLIDIRGYDFSQKIYDKPLVYYLLSHFMLAGIYHIHVITNEVNHTYLDSTIFQEFGLHFSYTLPEEHPLMIINHPWFIFGSDLTHQIQGAMLSGRDTKLVPMNQEPVIFFVQEAKSYFSNQMDQSTAKTLGRGMVCLDMSNNDKALDVASFVRTYQQNSGLLIGSLEEIAYTKGNITKQQLVELAKEISYGFQLLALTKPIIG